jgi:Domain of Unknown Function (DUF1080)
MIAADFRSKWLVMLLVVASAAAGAALVNGQQATPPSAQTGPPAPKPGDLGFTDTPMLPGLPFHVHDVARPHPPVVTPGGTPGASPSDAIVLFDGKDLSKWSHVDNKGAVSAAKWAVRDGYMEMVPKSGPLVSRERFGDVQLHVEWASPTQITRNSQGRGNSGVYLMGFYEVQVLDSYNNPSYADGQAGALYGQWPPLVNAARPPGQWQTYDIVFEAPRFEGDKLIKPAFTTVLWNGVVVHNRKEVMGRTVYRDVAKYTPHEAELPLRLQDHDDPVRFRNIWVRRLGGYDAQARK